jgi:excisionase family DNA binding protein
MESESMRRNEVRNGLPGDPGERLCISVPEAGRMLGISRNYAYELVRQGQLPVVRFGKRILIPRVALVKMLEKGA